MRKIQIHGDGGGNRYACHHALSGVDCQVKSQTRKERYWLTLLTREDKKGKEKRCKIFDCILQEGGLFTKDPKSRSESKREMLII